MKPSLKPAAAPAPIFPNQDARVTEVATFRPGSGERERMASLYGLAPPAGGSHADLLGKVAPPSAPPRRVTGEPEVISLDDSHERAAAERERRAAAARAVSARKNLVPDRLHAALFADASQIPGDPGWQDMLVAAAREELSGTQALSIALAMYRVWQATLRLQISRGDIDAADAATWYGQCAAAAEREDSKLTALMFQAAERTARGLDAHLRTVTGDDDATPPAAA